MSSEKFKKHFSDKLIDEINDDVDQNYFSPIISHLSSLFESMVICDIGCGNGVYTAQIKNKTPCKLIGIDANEYALKQARSNGFDEVIKIDDFSIQKLPLANGSVDFVICKDVLEHLIDPIFLIKEISRILKPNCRALIHVPNHFPIWGRIKFLITNNIDTFSYFPDSQRFDFPHIRFFTFESLNLMLEKSNFKIDEDLSYFFVQPRLIHRLIPIKLKKILAKISSDNFSEGLTILALKI